MSTNDSADLISIGVLSEVDGKKYKILVKEANFNKLKVEDIKKKLHGITGLTPSEQDISINGAILSDSWTAVDFGLHPYCQLTLSTKYHKNNNKNLSSSSSPPSSDTPSTNTNNTNNTHNTNSINSSNSKSPRKNITPPPPSHASRHSHHSSRPSPPHHPAPQLPFQQPSSESYIPPQYDENSYSREKQSHIPQQDSAYISIQEHERILEEVELGWKHKINNDTRKFLEEKKSLLKTANQDREHLLNENSKLRACIGDDELFDSKPPRKLEQLSVQEKHRLEEHITFLQAQLNKAENEKQDLARKFFEDKEFYSSHLATFEDEKKALLANFVEEKNKMIQAFTQEKEEWVEKFRTRLAQLPGISNSQSNSGDDPLQDLIGKEGFDWEAERAQILKTWNEETDVLTLIYDTEKQKWQDEKDEMLHIFEEERKAWNDQATLAATISASKIQQIQQQLKASKEKEEQLQVRLSQVRRVADERALIAQAAQRSIDDLKADWERVADGNMAISQAIVTATSQKNIEIQKVERLLAENENLSARVREEIMLRNLLSDKLDDILGRVRIVCRCRPLLSSEASNQTNPSLVAGETVVECKTNQVIIKSGLVSLAPSQLFDFSRVLGPTDTQKDAYDEVLSFVQSFNDGQNVLVCSYGHTGSGKSYNLFGGAEQYTAGIVPRAIEQIFAILKHTSPTIPIYSHPYSSHSLPPAYEWVLDCSVIELYLDEIFDLLSSTPDKPVFNFRSSHCTKLPFKNQADIQRVLGAVGKRRQIPGTSLSPRASQSHLMIMLQLRPESIEFDEYNNKESVHMGGDVPTSKLVFLDMAGAEHMNSSSGETASQRLKGDFKALGYIIQTLNKRGTFDATKQPASSLSATLQECMPLDYKTKILFFANITPSSIDLTDTTNTLTFATNIKTHPPSSTPSSIHSY